MDESNVEGELTLEPKVELNGQSKDDLQVPSKREQNRRKRQAHREATRETWLAQKKIKRKQKQLLKRENALKSNPADSSQLVKESNESSVKVEQASPSIAVIFDLGFDDYMLDKVALG